MHANLRRSGRDKLGRVVWASTLGRSRLGRVGLSQGTWRARAFPPQLVGQSGSAAERRSASIPSAREFGVRHGAESAVPAIDCRK
jgi:hypothetical protein